MGAQEIARDVRVALSDRDGSYRDVNFARMSWRGVEDFLSNLCCDFGSLPPELQTTAERTAFVAAVRAGGDPKQSILRGGSVLFRALQVFLHCDDDGSPFIELTFSPDDVIGGDDTERRFLSWLTGARRTLGAQRVYARYENMSWSFGDLGPQTGVFYAWIDDDSE